MLQDLRFVLRLLGRQRGFAAITVLTLALGVGLTTTMFSVADSLMFRPLPYAQPDRLYALYGAARAERQLRIPAAVGDHMAWRETGAFSRIATYKGALFVAIAAGREAHQVTAASVDEQFLPALGMEPAVGRAFTADDCREGARAVAVISTSLWRREFGADPAAIGKTIDVDASRVEIVGVLPADFLFPSSYLSTPGTPPVEMLRPLIVPDAQRQDHNLRGYAAVGRLADGIASGDAQARLEAAQKAVAPLYKPSRAIPGVFDSVTVLPFQQTVTTAGARAAVRFLFIAAFAVLLVAAANVANMLLARGAERARELAVRAAVGASRSRLARLLLAESLVLSLAGGILGLVLARVSFTFVVRQLPYRLIALRPPHIDLRVAIFACAVSLLVGVVFGLVPALRLSRADFGTVVKQAAPAATGQGQWVRDALVFAEICLAVMLIGTGLLVLRSFANLVHVDSGIDTPHVLTMEVTPPGRIARTASDARAAFFRTAVSAVANVSGVQAAAFTDNLLMTGGNRGSSLGFEGVDPSRLYTRGNSVSVVHVTPDYFRTMGMTFISGGPFPSGTGDEPLAIVSSRAARFAGVEPLGREVSSLRSLDRGEPDPVRYHVIGVVSDARERGLESDPMSVFYLPFGQGSSATLVVQAESPMGIAPAVRAAIHASEPTALVERVRPLDDLVAQSIAERRFNAFLYGAFSLSSLVLSALGVYGVVAYTVSRRTREIGIRVALGATTSRVVSFVTRRMLVVVGGGTAAGFVGLALLQGVLRSLVFNLRPNDPATLAGACLLIVGSALAAAYLPARRAARVDPMIALRAE